MATIEDVRAEIARRELARRARERAVRPLTSLTPEEENEAYWMIDSGMDPHEAARRVRLGRKQSAAVADVEDPQASIGEAALVGLGNGALGGNLDTVSAALGHGEGDTFAERKAANAADLTEIRRQHPDASFAGEVGGYVAPAAGAALGMKAVNAGTSALARTVAGGVARQLGGGVAEQATPKAISTLAGLATKEGAKRALKSGAVNGSIYGTLFGAFGTDTGEVGDIAEHAGIGGVEGAGLGAAFGLVPTAAGALAESPLFKRVASAVASPFESYGKNANELRALTTMGATGGSINAPAVLREAARMPGGVDAFAENLRRSGISKGLTTTGGIAKRAGKLLESSGKDIGRIIDEAADKGGMVDVDALVARLRHEARLASKGFEGVSTVSTQHTRDLGRIADRIEQAAPAGGMAPIGEVKALGASLGEDAEQAYRAQAAGRPVKGSGLALMDTRRAVEGGVGDAITTSGGDLEKYAAAKRDNQTARIAQEAAETSLGRAHKNNLIGLTTATLAGHNPAAAVVHHFAKPLMASGRATAAEGAGSLARFLKQTPAAVEGRAPMQAGNAAFAPRYRKTDASTTYNMLDESIANGWPTADDMAGHSQLRAQDRDEAGRAALASSMDEDGPSTSLLGELSQGTFKKPPPPPPGPGTPYHLLEQSIAESWPTADDLNSHADMQAGDELAAGANAFNSHEQTMASDDDLAEMAKGTSKKLMPASTTFHQLDEHLAHSWPTAADIKAHNEAAAARDLAEGVAPDMETFNDAEQRVPTDEDVAAYNHAFRDEGVKIPKREEVERRHRRADALPADRANVLQQILQANSIGDHDSARANAGGKELRPENGMLDAFDSSTDKRRGGKRSVLDRFIGDLRIKKVTTWRRLRDSGVLDKLAEALGLEDGRSLALPDEVNARHADQDAELEGFK